MKEVRFGIVGLGNQGSAYAFGLFAKGRIKNARLVALCDNDCEKLDKARLKCEDETVAFFSDYTKMLDSGLCDAVLIEVPHYLHPEIAIACLKRNIHVICEKPAGVYTEQVRRMNAAAEESSAVFAIMFNQRTNCVYRKMRELISSGAIGKLQRVTWIITDWFRPDCYYASGDWRATWAGEGGGVLINQCPHQLDLLQWVVGEMPTAVRGFCHYGRWHDVEAEDEVTAYLEYASGATGVFVTTTGEAPGTNRFEVSGTGGKLLVEGDTLKYYRNKTDSARFSRETKESFSAPEVEVITVETDGENPQHAGIINNFAAAILGKEKLFVDGREGIFGVELMNAIELSGWKQGARVELPVDEGEYLAQLEARCKTSRYHVRRAQGGRS